MTREYSNPGLGTQVILPDDMAAVESLLNKAATIGFDRVRLGMNWSQIEPQPGEWSFERYDRIVDICSSEGLTIKATLTPFTAPNHVATEYPVPYPETCPNRVQAYLQHCVERYDDRSTIGQWILTNEPNGGKWQELAQSDPARRDWQRHVESMYGAIESVNQHWGTQFETFEDIPIASDIEENTRGFWNWGAWQDEWEWRMDWLAKQLDEVSRMVSQAGGTTPTCVNPVTIFNNRAQEGLDLADIGETVDVLGATHHPPWTFTFVDRVDYPAVVAAGIGLQRSQPSVDRAEVTEVQTGNTYMSGNKPSEVTPGEVVKLHLAGLAAGAESVTGWCFNTRRGGWEAGDWALLDEHDNASPRSDIMGRLSETLQQTVTETGGWAKPDPRAWVLSDQISHGHEWCRTAETNATVTSSESERPGRRVNDGAHGSILVARELFAAGVPTALSQLEHLPRDVETGDLLIASNQVAWDPEQSERLLSFAESGGTLVIDAVNGRMNQDSHLQSPWPGGIAEQAGIRGVDLSTSVSDHGTELNGSETENWVLARMRAELNDAWTAWSWPRFAADGAPCVWQRQFGEGSIVVVRGLIGPTLVAMDEPCTAIRSILRKLGEEIAPAVRPAFQQRGVFTLPIEVENGDLTAVIAPDSTERSGRPIQLAGPNGEYHDFWSGESVSTGPSNEFSIDPTHGVGLLHRK